MNIYKTSINVLFCQFAKLNLILFVNSTDHNVSKRDQCLFENRLLIELLLYSKLDKLLTKKILHITVILLITQRGKIFVGISSHLPQKTLDLVFILPSSIESSVILDVGKTSFIFLSSVVDRHLQFSSKQVLSSCKRKNAT